MCTDDLAAPHKLSGSNSPFGTRQTSRPQSGIGISGSGTWSEWPLKSGVSHISAERLVRLLTSGIDNGELEEEATEHMAKYPATPTASAPATPQGGFGKRKIRCKMCRYADIDVDMLFLTDAR